MAELINLRRARKRKARAERKGEAQANRERYGVSRPDRERERAQREKIARDHESLRLDNDPK